MSVEQAILEVVRELPFEGQQEILSHAVRLKDGLRLPTPFQSIKGLWADSGLFFSAEEIDAVQREMWKGFPREDI